MLKCKSWSYLPLVLILTILGYLIVPGIFRVSPEKAAINLKEETERDPLFVSPELDADALDRSLNYFEEAQNEVALEFNIESQISPTNFMRQLAEVKHSHDKFISNPNQETGRDLIKAYNSAQENYIKDIETIASNIEQYFPYEKEQEFLGIGSSTTNRIVLDDLRLMIENGSRLKQEIDKRAKILDGRYNPAPNKQAGMDYVEVSERSLVPVINKYLPTNFISSDQYYIKTDCFQPTGEEVAFGYYQFSEGPQSYLIPGIINDNYYQAINKNDQSEKKLYEKGIYWRLMREGNTYRCNNLEYQADILAMRYYKKSYSQEPLLIEENKDRFPEELSPKESEYWSIGSNLEKNLGVSGAHDLNNFRLLGDIYRYFSLKKYLTDDNLRDNMHKRYLLTVNKQADLDLIINSKFSYGNIINRAKAGAITNYQDYAKYLYFTRNNYSFIYLNFSNSVWRINKHPRYISPYKENGSFANTAKLRQSYGQREIDYFGEVTETDVLAGY